MIDYQLSWATIMNYHEPLRINLGVQWFLSYSRPVWNHSQPSATIFIHDYSNQLQSLLIHQHTNHRINLSTSIPTTIYQQFLYQPEYINQYIPTILYLPLYQPWYQLPPVKPQLFIHQPQTVQPRPCCLTTTEMDMEDGPVVPRLQVYLYLAVP